MKQTSLTHPIKIAVVSAGPLLGRVGITFCPGKYDPHALGGSWDRDVALDLDAIQVWGAAAVVTLIEPHEFAVLRVEHLGEEVCRRGMAWFHLPIKDMSTPNTGFERRWVTDGDQIRSLLRSGRDVLVHCRGGLGRAGTIGARLLIELGMEPQSAIRSVRAVRPGAIETAAQEQYVVAVGANREHERESIIDWFEKLTGFHETEPGRLTAAVALSRRWCSETNSSSPIACHSPFTREHRLSPSTLGSASVSW